MRRAFLLALVLSSTPVILPEHTVEKFTREFLRELNFGQGVTLSRASVNDQYLALARAVRHYLMARWLDTLTRQRLCHHGADALAASQQGGLSIEPHQRPTVPRLSSVSTSSVRRAISSRAA